MYWFWFIVMASQPYLMLFGLMGVLGKDAERAANDLAVCIGIAVVIIMIIALIYFALRLLGLTA
ncbi:MAG: hypothetical protein K8F91_18650 [Candidatus Obscuribacterales bacterium]|nr:hypothetical protein [Candidatus Obscuribacterales bacterium]